MQTPEGKKVAQALRTSLHRLVGATAVLYIAIFALGFFVYTVARNNSEGLCAFRDDLHARNIGTKEFLRKHPRGTKSLPAGSLRVSLANGERTEKTLRHIHCPAPPPNRSEKPPKAGPPIPRGIR